MIFYRGFKLIFDNEWVALGRRGNKLSGLYAEELEDLRLKIDEFWNCSYEYPDLTEKQRNALERLIFFFYQNSGVYAQGCPLDASCCGTTVSVMRALEAKGLVFCIDTKRQARHSNRKKDAETGGVNTTYSRYLWTPMPLTEGTSVTMRSRHGSQRHGVVDRIRRVRSESPDVVVHWKPAGASTEFSCNLFRIQGGS